LGCYCPYSERVRPQAACSQRPTRSAAWLAKAGWGGDERQLRYGSNRKAVFPGKRVTLTIPFENTYAAAPRHTVGILTEALNYVGAEVVATVLAPGVHRRGEVREREDRVTEARKAGRKAVRCH
jgi:hypothetical protein